MRIFSNNKTKIEYSFCQMLVFLSFSRPFIVYPYYFLWILQNLYENTYVLHVDSLCPSSIFSSVSIPSKRQHRLSEGWSQRANFSISSACYSSPMTVQKQSEVVWLFATPWTVAYQAPLSMEFSRQEYWSGLPFPSPGDLPNPGIAGRRFNIWATRD